MEAETIREKTAELPKTIPGRLALPGEVWEGDDGGAHFIVSRHLLVAQGMPEFCSLSLSGDQDEVERLIGEFSEVFGQPDHIDRNTPPIPHVTVVSWLVEAGK